MMGLRILWVSVISIAAVLAASFPKGWERYVKRDIATLQQRVASGDCNPATSAVNLDINNVRCRLMNGGDMWWDLVGNPRYEVPKVNNPADARHSMFAGAVWIGGIDASGQLRIAAQTYRQQGNDYYPGPLRNDGTASTEREICEKWDKHFVITREQIQQFIADYKAGKVDYSKYPIIKDWPAINPDPDFEKYLAPFVDVNGDGDYNPDDGDYPDIIGDQAVWWVINDKGNIHSETGGQPIGIEMQIMAFAFATTNAINNMTFYKYLIINRSTLTLTQTYIGQWADPDLGYFQDDYVGCDTVRGLGYCYNGDADDESTQGGYGLFPPAIGIDFFQGPLADTADGIDNDKDGLVDEVDIDGKDNDGDGLIDEPDEIYERIGMAAFFYYNNDFSVIGNPVKASDFYGYLSGFWKDGSPVVDDHLTGNGNGYLDPGETGNPTSYMFWGYPGDANLCPYDNGKGWSEADVGNQPFDRRFVQSAGPFTLQPGAENEVIVGVVWSRDFGTLDNAQFGSVCALLRDDAIAQALFDANFQLLAGPDAPNLTAVELDREIILSWSYEGIEDVSNNGYENYAQDDPVLVAAGVPDPTFEFEGYLLYQLKDQTVSAADLDDPNKARVIAQCDIKNGISTIVNREEIKIGGQVLVQDKVMVQGADEGLFHTFRVTEDAFAEGADKRLVNYRKYYFAIVAYAFNDTAADGRKFLRGSRNFKVLEVMPHPTDFELNGLVLNSSYGDGVELRRVSNENGSADFFVELTPEVEQQILQAGSAQPVYQPRKGPIDVFVVDPKSVKGADYRVVILKDPVLYKVNQNELGDSLKHYVSWVVLMNNGGRWDTVYRAIYTMRKPEGGTNYVLAGRQPFGDIHYLDGHGIAILVRQVQPAGIDRNKSYGLVGFEVVYSDPSKQWLTFLRDNDAFSAHDWIRSFNDTGRFDPDEIFAEIAGGGIAPFCLAAPNSILNPGVAPGVTISDKAPPKPTSIYRWDAVLLKDLPNVDLVITPDPTKWSRCIMLETTPDPNAPKFSFASTWLLTAKARPGRTVIQADGRDVLYSSDPADSGFAIFPGYAIDVNTGKRLNIIIGEATLYKADNGDDMLWNPTSNIGDDGLVVGGRHYIYITTTEYDGGEFYRSMFLEGGGWDKDPFVTVNQSTSLVTYYKGSTSRYLGDLYETFAWVIVPMVREPFVINTYKDIPSEVRIKLRVNRPFFYGGDATLPVFEFSTKNLAPKTGVVEVAKESLLKDVRVVPNPFYTRSGVGRGAYEGATTLDARCKIINLPQRCTIRIFTLDGKLVRTFVKDSPVPEIEWDLKNDFGVPIASGIYLIHVDAGELGQKVVKFLVAMPEIDITVGF